VPPFGGWVWRGSGVNAIMAVCAHAQTAIFFSGAKPQGLFTARPLQGFHDARL
jgi:hypothetical protein